MNFILSMFRRVRALVARYLNKRTGAALLVVVVFLGFSIVKGLLSNGTDESAKAIFREVSTAPAGLVSQLEAVFETTGEVRSQTQGDLRAQRSGVITRVFKSVGQRVSAGTIIATIENASERASVAQAQAGVAQAQANFNKVRGGTRDEQLAVLSATTVGATQALEEAQIAAKNTLLNAYATTDAAVVGGADSLFSDADGANPKLKFISTKSSQALTAENARLILQATIDRHVLVTTRVALLDAPALRTELNTVERELTKIKNFLDNLATAVDGGVISASVSSTALSNYKTTVSNARSNILGTLSTFSSARGSLNGAQSALTVAEENQSQGVTGAQLEDIEVAQAQLDSAKAALAQAVAQLEDTRVRAPVTGVVTILTIDLGDFVSAFQDVGLVANEGSLEILAFVSPSAVERLAVGGSVFVDRNYEGVITSIALGVDPVKRQVEVRIALVSEDASLTNGSRTTVEFLNIDTQEIDLSSNQPGETTPILIPISALKLVGSDAFVFTVNASDSTLVAHQVELGAVVQASVEIVNGITRETAIVLDARGLNEGDIVVVAP